MVRFSHSIFALPFALAGAALAARESGFHWTQGLWVVTAMVCARNAAMGFNRLVDRKLDADNPRTARRELPAGILSPVAVGLFTALLLAGFVASSALLNRLCLVLSPVAVLIILGYSFTKRFTWGSHLFLGLALAIAPVGGWIAIAGSMAVLPWILAAAVLLWVAGFDVIYACQDTDHDRRAGLHSIPARFGIPAALVIARVFHLAALLVLAGVGPVAGLHPVYWAGLGLIAGLFLWEHRLVRADDMSRVDMAFFNMNGIIAVLYLGTILAAIFMGG